MNELPELTFYYRNWKGEEGYRTVKGSLEMWFGESQYHKGPQWFMKGYDVAKGDFRDFAVLDIIQYVK